MWILIIIIIFQLKTVAVSVCLTGVSLHSKSKKIYFSQIYIKHAKFSAKTFVQNNALIPEERICPSENKVQLILTLCHDVDTWKEKNVRPKYLSYLFSFFFSFVETVLAFQYIGFVFTPLCYLLFVWKFHDKVLFLVEASPELRIIFSTGHLPRISAAFMYWL